MKDEHRRKIKEFILGNSSDKIFQKEALDYYTKVVSCYINCVAYRASLIANHAKRITVGKKDLQLFYAVTTADCESKRLKDIIPGPVKLSKSVIRKYTQNHIDRYNQDIYDSFNLIISEFVVELSKRMTDNVSIDSVKAVMKHYHLFNFLTNPVCKNSNAKVI